MAVGQGRRRGERQFRKRGHAEQDGSSYKGPEQTQSKKYNLHSIKQNNRKKTNKINYDVSVNKNVLQKRATDCKIG